jgi:hypothetical protein
VEDLSEDGKVLLERLAFVQFRLLELRNQVAMLNRAKNAYISDLKLDFVRARTGIYLDGFMNQD